MPLHSSFPLDAATSQLFVRGLDNCLKRGKFVRLDQEDFLIDFACFKGWLYMLLVPVIVQKDDDKPNDKSDK